MDKHSIAKGVLFCEIGFSVGVYESIDKSREDLLNNKKNSGTHLLYSIEQSWSELATNGDINSTSGWDVILTSTHINSKTQLEVSKVISSKFFGQALNEKLQMLIYEGVKNARSELVKGKVYQ